MGTSRTTPPVREFGAVRARQAAQSPYPEVEVAHDEPRRALGHVEQGLPHELDLPVKRAAGVSERTGALLLARGAATGAIMLLASGLSMRTWVPSGVVTIMPSSVTCAPRVTTSRLHKRRFGR